ncbi:MAG TPA: hypothetical protein VFJ50_03260 [Gemmatimonadales bacterium]|nr:hypothetical protein [Gemmatimonadales bacterium]
MGTDRHLPGTALAVGVEAAANSQPADTLRLLNEALSPRPKERFDTPYSAGWRRRSDWKRACEH